MLHIGQTHRAGLILAPALETAQSDPKRQQVLKVPPGWLRQDASSISVSKPSRTYRQLTVHLIG
jgi:hypothetical protein